MIIFLKIIHLIILISNEFSKKVLLSLQKVENPEEFGVAEMDQDGNVISIEEKPTNPKSNDAVVGLYMFDNSVFNKIDTLEPSARGEYEITDLCNIICFRK